MSETYTDGVKMKSKKQRPSFPHDKVYTRLGRSKIQGVGVFAVIDIKKGTKIFADDPPQAQVIDAREILNLPKPIQQLYHAFAVYQPKNDTFVCPESFNRMTVQWYVNHSKKPNLKANGRYEFFALRNIPAGEELTVNYESYAAAPPTYKGTWRNARKK